MSIRRAIYNKYKTCFDYLYTGSSVQYEQYDSINVNDSGEIASFLFGLAFSIELSGTESLLVQVTFSALKTLVQSV